jgi:hypothetical protein
MRHPASTFLLDVPRIDDDLLRWVRAEEPGLEAIAAAVDYGPGFNLKTLMSKVLGGKFAMGGDNGKLGPLSMLLEDFGYWLFVGAGQPRVVHPPPFHLKTVTIKATRRDVTYDSRRVVIGVYGGGPRDPGRLAVGRIAAHGRVLKLARRPTGRPSLGHERRQGEVAIRRGS